MSLPLKTLPQKKPSSEIYPSSIPVFDIDIVSLECLLGNNDDGLMLLNEAGHIIYLSEKVKTIFGMEEFDGTKDNYSFVDIAKKHFQLTRPNIGEHWLEKGTFFLIKPQKENEKAQWIKVDTVPLQNESLPKYILYVRDYSDIIFLRQKIHCLEHSLVHQMSSPLNALTKILVLLGQIEDECTMNDLHDTFNFALESAEYLSFMFSDLLDNLYQKQPEEVRESSSLKKLLEDQIEKFKNDTQLSQMFPLDLPKGLETICLGHKEGLFKIVLTKLFALFHQFHPTKEPQLGLKVTSLPDGPSLAFTVISDYCFGIKDAIIDLQTFNCDPLKLGRPENFKEGFHPIDCFVTSLGGYCTIEDSSKCENLQITIVIPKK